MKRSILAAVVVAGGLFMAGCASRPPHDAEIAALKQCYENTRKLDEAKENIALRQNLKAGDIAPLKDVSAFIPGGMESLKCPSGGVYTNMVIGQWPPCSVHGSVKDIRKQIDALRTDK